MNAHQISRVRLNPSIVDCIVLWTKNPERLLPRLSELERYRYYFQFTITAYGQSLEPNVPGKRKMISLFKKLSGMLGPNRMIWRYDPIIFTSELNAEYHRRAFHSIAQALDGYTKRCVISFLDLYKKTERNLVSVALDKPNMGQMLSLARELADMAHGHGMEIVSCAEGLDLSRCGVAKGKCIDDKLIEELAGAPLAISKDPTQRPECGCMASIDIGAYNTCLHGCLYCYASFSPDAVRRNFSQHDPKSPLLFGRPGPGDTISDRKVASCLAVQKRLFT
jgi:hypothetical protein